MSYDFQLPTTIINNEIYRLCHSLHSALLSQLNGIQNKHMRLINKPQSSDVFKWTYITISMWRIQKTRMWLFEYHLESLLPFKRETRWHITIGFGADVLAFKTEINHQRLLETYYTELQSIPTYCCTCQSLNHNKSRSKIYFGPFNKMMIICTDWDAFSTFYSKTISLPQDTTLMT